MLRIDPIQRVVAAAQAPTLQRVQLRQELRQACRSEESRHARAEHHHRGDVLQVVVEDVRQHLGRDAGEVVLPVNVRDQVAGHILGGALEAQHIALQVAQAARTPPRLPQPAGGRQQIEVRRAGQRRRHAGQHEAVVDQRHVEAAAVEADDAGAAPQRFLDQVELGALLGRVAHEELADDKGLVLERPRRRSETCTCRRPTTGRSSPCR